MEYQHLGTEALLQACVSNQDPAAWEEFIRRYHDVIARSVLRNVRRSQTPVLWLVEDLVQETFLKLCKDDYKVLKSFKVETEDSLYGFLKVVAANIVRDYVKKEMAGRHGGGVRTHTSAQHERGIADPRAPEREMDRRVLMGEIEACLNLLVHGPNSERDKQIFRFKLQGYTAEAIAALPNIGLQIKGVESTVKKLATQLRHRLVERSRAKGKEAGTSL